MILCELCDVFGKDENIYIIHIRYCLDLHYLELIIHYGKYSIMGSPCINVLHLFAILNLRIRVITQFICHFVQV